jgi:hypothetical protein
LRAHTKTAMGLIGRAVVSQVAIASRFLGVLIALATIAGPVFAMDNEQFAEGLDGVKPVLWKDYEPVYRDFVGCIAGIEPTRLTHSVCAHLHERRNRMLWDALKQAALLNVAPNHRSEFCSDRVTSIVADHDAVEGGTLAAYMMEFQLRGGAGPYGADLSVTYLGKIVHDALVKITPCR